MSGVQLALFPKTTIDMGTLAIAGQGPEVFYALNVNVVRYREAMLLVRMHSKTMPVNSEVQFGAYNSAPTAEDPAIVFRSTTNLISGFKMPAATGAPVLLTNVIPTTPAMFGGNLDFSYRPLYVVGGGSFVVTMSIDLVLKY